MTKLVAKYLELRKEYAFDLPKEREPELLDELSRLKRMMTIEELESLKNYVSARQFYEGIMPLIKAKQERAVDTHKRDARDELAAANG